MSNRSFNKEKFYILIIPMIILCVLIMIIYLTLNSDNKNHEEIIIGTYANNY